MGSKNYFSKTIADAFLLCYFVNTDLQNFYFIEALTPVVGQLIKCL